MAKPVDLIINVKADTGEVAPGMKALDRELDQATKSAKALDKELQEVSDQDIDLDVNTQAIKAARDRIDDLRDDIANTKALDIEADTRQAEQEIAKLKRSIKALTEDDGGGGGGVDLGPRLTEGLDEAGEGLEEFKGEADGTAREVAASFDGSIESIAGGFQELAANALGGWGPAGAVAGLALAAGIGIGVQALTKAADEANAAKQEVVDLAAAIREAGGTVEDLDWVAKFQEFGDTIVDTKSWFELWQKDSTTALERAADVAKKTGGNFEDIFKGMAGDVPSATKAIADLDKRIAEQQKVVDNLTTATGGLNTEQGRSNAHQREALFHLKGYRSELEDSLGTVADAIKRNEQFAEAMGMTVEEYQASIDAQEAGVKAQEDAQAAMEDTAKAAVDAAKAQADAYSQMVEAIADPVATYQGLMDEQVEAEKTRAQAVADGTEDSADSWEDYATDVKVTTQDLIDEWTRQAEAQKKFEENLAIIGAAGGKELAAALRAQGPEVASAAAEAIASDPSKMEAAFKAYGEAAGNEWVDGVTAAIRERQARLQAALAGALAMNPGGINVGQQGVVGFGASAPAPAPAAAPGNVRVYIDGNQLRATVRTDISAASARAALVSTGGRGRP